MVEVEIMVTDIFANGSTWIKADFHLHTRADSQFVYRGEDNSFVKEYIAKLQEASISVGIITNHNKFCKTEFLGLRDRAKAEGIYLLPGLELSVKDGSNGVHTLVVFSDDWVQDGKDYINQFLNIAFAGKTPSEYEQENGRCSMDIETTISTLNEYHRDYFLVFAHIEQKCGLWKELGGGRLEELGKNEQFKSHTLGFQKVRACRDKAQHWFGNWYPAEVEGSDCKSIEEIGTKNGETWMKIGGFTFEAVKFALLDHKSRIRSSKPEKYSHSFIKSITFEGGILKDRTINLSPELNTFIGIRGSGKSSILEAIRYVLDIPFGDQAVDKKYKQDLVAFILGSGGKASITAQDQYGIEFQIKRVLGEFPEVYINGKEQPGVSIRETIIRKPVYFGQKDLSSSGEGFEKDLVEKLIGDSLYDIRLQIEEKKQNVADIVRLLQKLTNVDEKIAEQKQLLQDAEFNLQKFQEYGIEEKFKKQTDFDTDERKVKHIIHDAEEFSESLESLITQYEDMIKNHLSYESCQNQDFFKDFLTEYTKVSNMVHGYTTDKTALETILQTLRSKQSFFMQTKKSFIDEFAETRRKIEAELKEKGAVSLNLEEFPSLKRKIDNARILLGELVKQKNQASSMQKNLLLALSELTDLWQKEFQAIKKRLDIINDKNSPLQIDAVFKGDKTGFLAFCKNMFRGSGIRETMLSTLIQEYSDFGSMYKDFETVKHKVGSFFTIFEKYFFENLQSLLTYQVLNKFTIKYRGKELQQHSLGQRASALILFVLNQKENDVIIVDQPEDDLDNQTIYEDVIKLVKEMKSHTQFIFATHNANFPVLGDAEQIHACRFENDVVHIKTGSIDSPVLQKEVVDIMEGGEDAFNKRKEIYGIWKPQN